MKMLVDAIVDTTFDCLKMLPFLFVAFILIEALEHYSSDFTAKALAKVGRAGPVVGAVAGCVPDSRLWQRICMQAELYRWEPFCLYLLLHQMRPS